MCAVSCVAWVNEKETMSGKLHAYMLQPGCRHTPAHPTKQPKLTNGGEQQALEQREILKAPPPLLLHASPVFLAKEGGQEPLAAAGGLDPSEAGDVVAVGWRGRGGGKV